MTSKPAPYLALSVSEAAALPIPTPPEHADHQTFTSLLDHRAQHQPSHLAVGFPLLEGKEGLTFTYAEIETLSRRVAARLKDAIQPHYPTGRQPVVAILAPSGPDFLMNVLACWRLGASVLPIALGTLAKGAANLLQVCECNVLLYCSSQADLAKEIKLMAGGTDMTVLADWREDRAGCRTVDCIYKAGPEDVLVIFHSSGSSGTPKPLAQLQRFWSTTLMNAPGISLASFTTTPLFHGGLSDFFRSAQAAAAIYFYPWHLQVAPTTSSIVNSIECCRQRIAYFLSVPFILEMLIDDERGVRLLQGMDLVSTGGAPLTEAIGDMAVNDKDIKLVSRLGSSECGFLMSSFRDFDTDKEWSWLRNSQDQKQPLLCFEPSAEAERGLFQLVVSSRWPSKQLHNRPDGAFATGDLFERHPRLSNRWRYKGRGDESIVMINGKKANGAQIESLLRASSLIDDAVVFGASRPLLGAIIFPSKASNPSTIRQDVRPLLQAINAKLPSHGRILLEMTHIGQPSLYDSLPRSSKGTLQRGLALETMDDLLNDMYRQFIEGEAPRTEEKKSLNGSELREWLRKLVEEVAGSKIGTDDDFYRSGVDSIMAARIRAGVHQSLELQGFRLASNDIYDHPTVAALSRFIESRGKEEGKEREKVMLDMVEKYSNFGSTFKAKDDLYPSNGSTTVLLTGATGALGCRILYELVEGEASVDKVICLVRAKDALAARDRVQSALRARGIKIGNGKKFDCVTNLWELGLKRDVVEAAHFTVIHSAWIVNFRLRLESFEQDCIAGLKDLLDFFASCLNAQRFVFCSSLASITNASGRHPEKASSSSADSGAIGYANSKWVAETICRKAGPRVVIARIGQLCGDTRQGNWNTTEAWPLMIRTAQEVGCLPESGPDIDWLPVDVAARALVDICRAANQESRFVHIALPQNVPRPTWPTFLEWLRDCNMHFKTVTKADWLDKLREKADQVKGSALYDIWEKVPQRNSDEDIVDARRAAAASESLAQVKAVDQDLCRKMVQAWRSSGFLL